MKKTMKIYKGISKFYSNGLTSNIVDVVPFAFTVKDGQKWDSKSDSATMYIRIPKLFNMSVDDGKSIYLVRVKEIDGEVQT